MSDTTALTVIGQNDLNLYQRMGEPMTAVERMGKWFASSGMLGIRTPEQGNVVALTCMLEGLTPLEFIRTYDIVEGKPAKKAAAMQAEFLRRGGRITWLKSTTTVCAARAFHPELCPDGWELEVTLEELKKSGVATDKGGDLKANYKRSPRQMLRARVVAELVRMIDPSINAGIYAPEELEEEPEQRVEQPRGRQVVDATGEEVKVREVEPEPVAEPEPEHEPAPPPKAKKRNPQAVIDAFAPYYVLQSDLESYVEVPVSHWGDEEFETLRAIYLDIKDAPNPSERARQRFNLEPGATVED